SIKDPGLPWLGAKTGFPLLGFILPRLIPALILAGLMKVLVPQEIVARHLGREGGLRGIVIAAFAGVLTPGGPMVTVPCMVALANSGAAMPPLVAYMTPWSLFGMQRIIAWEAPLMGWRFLLVRVIPSLAFPVLASWLVAVFHRARLAEGWRKLGTLLAVVKAAPRHVTTAPWQEIVETQHPSLAGLPVLRCWPGDAGRFITLPCVFTRDPVRGQRNVGMYRLQVFDDQ